MVLNAYGFLKFLHVVSVIVWVGGVAALSVVAWRMRNERDRQALTALVRQASTYGERVAGPASFIVLLTGPMMVGMAHIGFGTFWVLWGFAGLTAHFWIGATALRRRTSALLRLASGGSGDDAAILVAARSLWSAQLIYLAIMAAVVAAMVLKPTL
jgi:putative copper export protein